MPIEDYAEVFIKVCSPKYKMNKTKGSFNLPNTIKSSFKPNSPVEKKQIKVTFRIEGEDQEDQE